MALIDAKESRYRFSISQACARKMFDGWAMFWRGTQNEIYQGERFKTVQEARNMHRVRTIKECNAC